MIRAVRRFGALLPLLFVLALAPAPAEAVEGTLTVDLHWMDAIQAADHATMSVTESYFFNNTGSAAFSGNLSFRILPGAQVESAACNGAPNTAARIRDTNRTDCFFLQDLGGGTRQGRPSSGMTMSYYGQRDALTLWANSSLGDRATLAINVTVGAAPAGQAVPPRAGPGLHLATNATELGGLSPSAAGLLSNLTYLGNFTLYNNRTENASVNLSAALGGTTWNVTILDGGTPVATAPLLMANASKRFDLRVVVPNYLLQVEIDYLAQMPSAGDKKWSLPVDYLYPVRTGEYFIFLLESDNTTGSAPQAASFGLVHSAPTWQATMNRWWFFYIARDLPAGARVDLSVYTDVSGEISPVLVGLLAIVGAAALIGLAFYLRARRRKEGEEVAEPAADDVAPPEKAAKPPGPGKPTPAAEVARYRKALHHVETDHEMGRLPDDSYERLKAKYEEKIQTIEADAAKAASSELAELHGKKERILRAIRDLRAERDAGAIDPDTAKELEAGYREEAVALMKRLDELE
jgi:hypothetical protein